MESAPNFDWCCNETNRKEGLLQEENGADVFGLKLRFLLYSFLRKAQENSGFSLKFEISYRYDKIHLSICIVFIIL